MADLASALECIPLVRKRFRKGRDWIREPVDYLGEGGGLQTTKAMELNYAILRVVFKWMPSQKISVYALEPQASQGVRKLAYIDTC